MSEKDSTSKRNQKIKGQNRSKKEIKTKDKRSAKKVVGTLQRVNSEEVGKSVLHLWKAASSWFGLEDRPYVGEGRTFVISQVRLEGVETSMLQLQYKQGWDGSRFLFQNVTGNRRRKNGKTSTR